MGNRLDRHFRFGSKCEELALSICSPRFAVSPDQVRYCSSLTFSSHSTVLPFSAS
jgi:hypothetical protein